jgi:hypothetical protein
LFGSADFVVLGTPLTPLIVQPGEEIDFTVSFTPTTAGVPEKATIRVITYDPTAPFVDIEATGQLSPDFFAPSVLSYPLLVDSGDSIDVVVRFQPSSFGPKSGTITIFRIS